MPRSPHRPRTPITEEHEAAIRRLSGLGVLQSEIARRLAISASAVARVQARERIAHLSRGEGRALSLAGGGR